MEKCGFFTVFNFCRYYLDDKLRPFYPAICFEMARDIWSEFGRFQHLESGRAALTKYLSLLMSDKDRFKMLEMAAYDKIVERIGEQLWREKSLTQNSKI